jgi:hypothetical protein
MALLEDLKQDLKDRIDRIDNVNDMLILFEWVKAPLDTSILETYFAWYRVKTLDEVSNYQEDPDYYLIDNVNTQFYATEVGQVRLLQIEDDTFINKNFHLELKSWMIEPLASSGGT